MNFRLRQLRALSLRHLLSLAGLSIAALAAATAALLPNAARANDWDLMTLSHDHVSISYDAGMRADARSLRYLARFIRATQRLPDGVSVQVICYDRWVELRLDEDVLMADSSLDGWQEAAARVGSDLSASSTSRLRSCLAQAARHVRRAVPSFRPERESAQWYAVSISADEIATYGEQPANAGMGLIDAGISDGLLASCSSQLTNGPGFSGFFLTREGAERGAGELGRAARMDRRRHTELLCHIDAN